MRKTRIFTVAVIGAAALVAGGCAGLRKVLPPTQMTRVFSTPAGAQIEVDGKPAGRAPTVIKWTGNQGRYFNDQIHIVKAYLECEGCCPQSKLFSGGAIYSTNDVIPAEISFDMRSCAVTPAGQDVNYTR